MKILSPTVKRLLTYLRPHRRKIFLSLLFSLLTVACNLLLPYTVREAIDIALPGNTDFKELTGILLFAVILALTGALCQWVLSAVNNRIGFSVVKEIREEAFRHLQHLPIRYADTHTTGDTVSRIVSDAEQICDGLLLGFSKLFSGVLTVLGTVWLMFLIKPAVAICVIVLSPLSLFAAKRIASFTHSMFLEQSAAAAAESAYTEEQISGLKTVKALGEEDRSYRNFGICNETLRIASLRAVFFSSLVNPVTRFVNNLIYAVVALTGGFFAISGGLTVGGITCLLSYANQYTKPFNEISGVITEIAGALAGAERVFALLDEEPQAEPACPDTPLSLSKEIRFENVTFSYDGQRDILNDLSFTAAPGKTVALVGPTGCGKTTVINLLMRFYDATAGTVTIGGQDIRTLPRHLLRRQFGMVLQDTWFFEGTVRDNIAFGRPDASEQEIIAAAKAAHAHGFICHLPHGYATVIGGKEGTLSEGQLQLLSVARVILANPPMLILDEATSSIDSRTEQQVQAALGEMMRGRTCIVVAHRLSTIQSADLILAIDRGKIMQAGTHRELLNAGGFYAELYNSQYKQ